MQGWRQSLMAYGPWMSSFYIFIKTSHLINFFFFHDYQNKATNQPLQFTERHFLLTAVYIRYININSTLGEKTKTSHTCREHAQNTYTLYSKTIWDRRFSLGETGLFLLDWLPGSSSSSVPVEVFFSLWDFTVTYVGKNIFQNVTIHSVHYKHIKSS